MLGEKLGDITGKVTGQRVVAGTAHGEVKLEVSFEGMGHVLGIEATDMGTYQARMKAPGVLYGSGQGLTMTKDGDSVTWHGEGIGTMTGKGMGAHWRGAIVYSTQSTKLGRLNSICGVFEWDVDEHGNAKGAFWEWK